MTLTETTKQYVKQRAKYLCEYWNSPEEISTSRFTIDHIKPRSLDGTDDVNNLALACSRCNQRRYNFTVQTYFKLALGSPRRSSGQERTIALPIIRSRVTNPQKCPSQL